MTTTNDWAFEHPAKITVCDAEGTITYMNRAAREAFAEEGGAELIGTSLLERHPEPSKSRLREMLDKGEGFRYVTERRGEKALVDQATIHRDGAFAGLVEIVIPFADDLPLRVRD
ncbi:MAG: PAS domain-containing protein [Ignavibacteriales bacterium]|nr:PAS domain-containing protein [Ignavibacteriales bacterium]